ncbi:MAG: hypothetical protein KDA84_12040 [Planctomycetaceae bacterium]|nr:hypothetical protein [Planctomycetaceae bacterium]
MKRIAIRWFTFYPGSDKISAEHHAMFHGEAFRSGMKSIHAKKATWFNSVRTPLQLVHSKQLIPDLFQPAHNLVVSEAVKEKLLGLNKVGFLKVEFEKLVDFYSEKGVFEYYDMEEAYNEYGEPISPEEHLISLPDDPEAHKSLKDFYEVIIPTDKELVDGKSFREVEIEMEPPSWHGNPLVIRYNQEQFEQHFLIKAQSSIIFEPSVFERIRPHIDFDYFLVKEFDL